MYLAFFGEKAHSFLRYVKRLVTTANKKETELPPQIKKKLKRNSFKQLRAELQQNNLLANGGLAGRKLSKECSRNE